MNNVNQKDHFPLLFIDAILDGIASYECFSFLDGFLGYNQIMIALAYRAYTTFIIDWDTFAYNIMLIGLYNALATFQRVMIIAF